MRLSLSCVALLPGAIAWSCEDSGVSLTLTDLPAPAPVCNDGTPAQYFFLPASSGKADETLIYLSGGGQCSDKASCAARFDGSGYVSPTHPPPARLPNRQPHTSTLQPFHDCTNSTEASPCFMSDKDFPETCTKGGVLEMMAQRNANVVYVPYCSSDGWMGDKKFGDFEMRGAAIALAVVDALKPVVGGGGKVVFGGGSAGGRGAAVLLDAVAERLEGVAEVVGFLDSPYVRARRSSYLASSGAVLLSNVRKERTALLSPSRRAVRIEYHALSKVRPNPAVLRQVPRVCHRPNPADLRPVARLCHRLASPAAIAAPIPLSYGWFPPLLS